MQRSSIYPPISCGRRPCRRTEIEESTPLLHSVRHIDGAHAIKHFLLPSHIVGLDYDHVANRLEVIQRCAADPHTVAAIESPTDGVKVFAYVEGIEGRHREGQQLVSRYYNQLLGLESDPACKGESVCVISVILPMDTLPVSIRHLLWNH